MNALFRALLVAVVGGLSGFLIGVAFTIAMSWFEATDAADFAKRFSQDWHWSYTVFVSSALGIPVGAFSAVLADLTVFRGIDLRNVITRVPFLFGAVLLGAFASIPAPPLTPIAASLGLVLGAMWVRTRWERRSDETKG